MNLVTFLAMSSFIMISLDATMRANIYGCQCVEQIQCPLPSLKKNHVLVQVHAAHLNPVDAKDVLGDKLPHSWTNT